MSSEAQRRLQELGMLPTTGETAPTDPETTDEPEEEASNLSLTQNLTNLRVAAEQAGPLDLNQLDSDGNQDPELTINSAGEAQRRLQELGMLPTTGETAPTDPETTDEPEEEAAPAANGTRFRRLDALRRRIAEQNGIPFPRREDFPLSMPDLSSLLDLLPARDRESGLRRRLQRLFPDADEAFIETQLEKLRNAAEDTEATTSKFKEYLDKMRKDVPWQTMVLSTGKPIAKMAATTVIRGASKDLAAIPLTQLLGATSLVAPVAAGVIAGLADTHKLATGGREKLYRSAAQDTWAALTTWKGTERKGNESEAEFNKNRLSRPIAAPIFLLRKVGALMNTLRSENTKLWMGITRDRSKISKELARIDGGAETISNDELSSAILTQLQDGAIQKEDLLKLNRPLARLRAVSYGTIDVAGERGTRFNRVAERHTAARLQQLHEVLHQLISSDQIDLTQSEKERWNTEYDDVERKKKDITRKVGMIVGNSLATFVTLGLPTFVRIINEKIEEFDFEGFKEQLREQIEEAQREGLLNFSEDGDEISSGARADDVTEGLKRSSAENINVDAVEPETVTADISETPGQVEPADIDRSEIMRSDAGEIGEATEVDTDLGATEVVADAQPEPFGMGTNRVDADFIQTDEVTTETFGTADRIDGVQAEEVSEVADATTAVESADVADAAIEIQDLGDDELPWNAIYSSIQNNPSVNVSNINGTTNVIKNIYKALNNDLPVGVIRPDSGFAILPDAEIPTELPEGAVAYFFSEEQIENLAEQIDQAINLSKEGAELTDMQETLVQLNGGRISFEDLAQDPDLLEDILEIANER